MLVLGIALFAGCHNRAYNDLYVESMAAEIRDLEDQLYEYDHEYRVLEQKLAVLQSENNARTLGAPQKAPKAATPLPSFEFQPRPATPLSPAEETIKKPAASAAPSILESQQESVLPQQPSGSAENLPLRPAAEPTPPRSSIPRGIDRLPSPPDSGNEFDLDLLSPPTIELGEPQPPPSLLPGNGADNRRPAPEDDLEMNLSRIEVPTQLATGNASAGQAKLTIAAEQVTDTRVIELAFHPAHSRSVNFDDDDADDGLVLLLLPKNERGQMVPAAAALSIVVLDPAREGAAARIGRWDYSAAEIKQKIQPLGTNQGIQLTLPWNGPDPSADRVIVFARYTFENGRQVIGQKEIYVTSHERFKTVWAPRGRSGNSMAAASSKSTASAGVAIASFQASGTRAPDLNHTVRPAAGTTTLDPAPSPHSPAVRR